MNPTQIKNENQLSTAQGSTPENTVIVTPKVYTQKHHNHKLQQVEITLRLVIVSVHIIPFFV